MKISVHQFLLFFSVFLLVVACQKEEEEIIDQTPGNTVTADSELVTMLQKTAQNSGSIDDFIDGSPCSSIQFPYQVEVNGQTLTIENTADLEALAGTSATIALVFPVTIVFEDFSTLEIASQEMLHTIAQQCEAIDEAIRCIDVVYPITFYTYNSENEQTDSVEVSSDADLFAFLTGLSATDYISIQFPIEVVLADGSLEEVTSNTQLQDLIAGCGDYTNNPDPTDFESLLTEGTWYVNLFIEEDEEDGPQDETYHFDGYAFNFQTDGSVSASKNNYTVYGNWSIQTSGNGTLKLDMEFDGGAPFDELEDDWDVLEYSAQYIRLKDVSGGDGDTDYLNFSRTPNTGNSGEVEALKNILKEGSWFVASYIEDGEDDDTANFDTFSFHFHDNGTVEATNHLGTLTGNWYVGGGSTLKLLLHFSDSYPLDELDDDWEVSEVQGNLITLRDDTDADADILIFEKK